MHSQTEFSTNKIRKFHKYNMQHIYFGPLALARIYIIACPAC